MIEVSGLRKTFVEARPLRQLLLHPFKKAKTIRALRGVDFTVRKGEIVSLLGPNGAGKTTLLKILSCLVLPDEGSARIDGVDTREERYVKPKIGLVHSDERSFYWRLSARENLEFFATLYDVPRKLAPDRIQQLLERVDMADAADRPFSTYSSGMKQRVAIVRALLHDPPVLFMDEPTRSLDPASSLSLRRFVREEMQAKDGKTVLIATHDLKEAEAISDRIAILAKGRLLQFGTVQDVRRWGIDRAVFEMDLAAEPNLPEGPYSVLDRRPADPGRIRVRLLLDSDATLDDLLRRLLDADVRVYGCDAIEPDLEEAFTRILGAGATEDEASADGASDGEPPR